MRLKEYPIGDYVGKCQTWNPKSSGVGSFDYIDLSSVDKDTKSIASIERYECSDAPSRARQLVETDDVLVATVRPNLNGVALVNGAHHGMTASTGYCVIRPDKDKLDSRFLFHWVKTGVFVQRMVDVATGANYPAVSDAKVKASKIPLPPLAEQKRIAAILDAADALRAKRREALAQLDTLLQSTFLDMFGDPVTNPMGWEAPALSEVTDEIYRYPTYFGIVYENEGVPEIRGELIGKGGKLDADPSELRFIAQVTSDKFPRTQLAAGDLVMSVRGTIGKIGIVPAELTNANITANLIRISPARSIIDPVFLLHVALGPYFLNQLSRASSSTTIKTIKALDLKVIPIPLPPLDLQRRFTAIVESVEQQTASQRAHLAELDTLFASLQSLAFRGDL